VFDLDGVTIGALVCNDMWCSPEFTVQDDPHLSQKLADMGAKLIVHAVNSGLSRGNEGELYRQYHDANLRIRARAGKVWIITADACDAAGQMISNAPSGIVDFRGKWVARTPDRGERFVAHAVEL
jgi:predicted amidohydrolase